jgi:hypothetical protein
MTEYGTRTSRPVGAIPANSPVWVPAKSASIAALPVSASRFFSSGRGDDSAAAAVEDGYRVAEIVGTMGEAARPQTTVPVTFGT